MNPWSYKGFLVFPADRNSSGIRWTASAGIGIILKADTKQSMKQLINEALKK